MNEKEPITSSPQKIQFEPEEKLNSSHFKGDTITFVKRSGDSGNWCRLPNAVSALHTFPPLWPAPPTPLLNWSARHPQIKSELESHNTHRATDNITELRGPNLNALQRQFLSCMCPFKMQ